MNGKLRILLADDHFVVRMGIASLLSFEQDMEVVGEADTGRRAVRRAKELKPDVVLMDLMMPELDGAEATRQIKDELPDTKVLILTTFGESHDIVRALENGASGALIKTEDQTHLLKAIRTVAAGGRAISREIQATIDANAAGEQLTARQIEVLAYVAKGLTNREIGDLLGISGESVKDHLSGAFRRLGASNRSEAITLARNRMLI